MIAFVQPGKSEVARLFEREQWPAISEIAQDMNVAVRVVDVADGAPADVSLTPMLVFQNFRGRSIYLGRINDLKRIRNFMRTAQRVPQSNDGIPRERTPLWRLERMQLAAKLKITPLGGATQGVDTARFESEAAGAIEAAFKNFRVTHDTRIKRGDRLFYMDFHPWRSPEGELLVAAALFSQFNCKVPVFEMPGTAAKGAWEDRGAVFGQAAVRLEQAVRETMQAAVGGDGFDPVPQTVPLRDWDALGLALPPKPAETAARTPPLALKRMWQVAQPAPGAGPMLQFRFAAPLDSYSGEVTGLQGKLTFDQDLSLSSARGWFQADPKTVTMGEPLLDEALQGALFLNTKTHPGSRFTIENTVGGPAPLAWGQQGQLTLSGQFQLKGVTVPLIVDATIEPLADEDGRALLQLTGRFMLDIRPFDLEGPDGPEPATHTMMFDFEVLMRP